MKATVTSIVVSTALLLIAIPTVAQDENRTDRISLKGDVRLRYENIAEDGLSDRERMRFRARFGLSASITDEVKVVVQLATGGSNPVSTNQSFDGGFSTKDIGVDLAYVEWKINEKLAVAGGKIRNPQFKAGGVPLIWDADLNPEGFSLKYSEGRLFATLGAYSVEERSGADDSLLSTIQAGYKFQLGEGMALTAGAGYFAYSNTIGNAAFFDGSSGGNTLDSAGNYSFDYKNTELFAQFDTYVGRWPLTVYAHAVRNNEVTTQDSAIAYGAKIGLAKSDGDAEFSLTYQDIEADAVIATFSGSDFGGGGTDAIGYLLKAKYAVSKKIFLGGTVYLNEVDGFQGLEHDYDRVQLDLEFKFL